MSRMVRSVIFWIGILAASSSARAGEVYQGPSALAATRDGRTLFVANADAGNVARIDVGRQQVIRRISVPATPTGLTLLPDDRRLVVVCAAPKSVVLILDVATGKKVQEFRAGHGSCAPVVSADGRRLFLCNRFDNNISVFDLESGRELRRVPAVREPIAAALSPDGKTHYVANHLPLARTDREFTGLVQSIITVVDVETLTTSEIRLPHGSNSLRGICVSPDGAFVFVTHLFSNFEMVPFRIDGGWINVNALSVIDVKKRKVRYTAGLDAFESAAGNPWDVICTPNGKWVCVSLAGTHRLCVIETRELLDEYSAHMAPMMGVWPIYPALGDRFGERVALPGKGPRALAVAGNTVFAAEYFSDAVAKAEILDTENVEVSSIPVGPEPKMSLERRGELLFHDATISQQHWLSCASCHPDGRVDALNWDLLNDGEGNPKNTKSMLYAHRTPPAMAEGVRMSAEEAVRSGISTILFAYRREEDARAIDAYLKSLRPLPSPHLVDGRLSESAERGKALFAREDLRCDRCHPAPLFTDCKSHDVGSRTPREKNGKFDTPSLVECWRTAPYLHDGRYVTIPELLHEGKHGLGGGRLEKLTDREINDLVEYVLSL